ncbi:hypothetical protein L218DRAFT_949481 [Marasmius fiardii PR-910]|nr:hypothetical protein L218DRAFT_949481 [Marasmius fiardii PR-910]
MTSVSCRAKLLPHQLYVDNLICGAIQCSVTLVQDRHNTTGLQRRRTSGFAGIAELSEEFPFSLGIGGYHSNGMFRGTLPSEGNFLTISTVMVPPVPRTHTRPFACKRALGWNYDMRYQGASVQLRSSGSFARPFVTAKAWDGCILKPTTMETETDAMIRDTARSIQHGRYECTMWMLVLFILSMDSNVPDRDVISPNETAFVNSSWAVFWACQQSID